MTRWIWGRLSRRGRWLSGLVLAAIVLFLGLWWWPLGDLFRTPRSTVLLDRNGHLLGASVAADGQWRFPPTDSIPERFATCLIQFEDRHFLQHHGVHVPSLVRALEQNASAGRTVSGGSTLTMQVARLSRNGRQRTIGQKLIEMVLAVRIELRHTKQEILSLFAGNAPFGGNVVGLDAAAWRYFGRAPRQLTWAESATLAVLPNAPSAIYPGHGQQALRAKRDRLLARLLAIHAIDSLEWSLAVQEPLPEGVHPLPQRAPHLLATLRATGHEGERVRTTVDADLQERATTALLHQAGPLKANEVHNAAALVMDVRTGEVLAYVGNLPGTGPDHAEAVDIVRAERSTGSLLKPFLYADMLQTGERTPDMLVADLPTRYDGFSPRNYDERYLGAVPASQALARSLNVPAVRALRTHGVERTLKVLRGMGLRSIDRPAGHYGLSLIVGGAECDLWSLTGAYASMGRALGTFGVGNAPAPVHDPVVIRSAAALPSGEPCPLSAGALYFTMKALREVKRPESEGDWQRFANSEAVAWKTGTSMGHRDAWAIGLTDRYCVGVWTGNADGEGRPGLTGTLAAAPLLFELFAMLPRGNGFEVPYDDLVQAALCTRSGHLANPDCDRVEVQWVPRGAERTPTCPYHQRILVDAAERYRVAPGADGHERAWFSLPPGMEHYYMERDPTYMPLPMWKDDPAMATSGSDMEIIYPEPGSRVAIPIELDGSRGRLVAEAAHRVPGSELHWSLDGRYIGTTRNDHRLAIDAPEGTHVLLLTDAKGNRTQCRFDVIGERKPTSRRP